MASRKLRNAGRRKALFGIADTGDAAILAAAGINAATQMAAAGINSAATKQAAREQADATLQNAQRQAEAIKDQTDRSREYQMNSQNFIKEENAQNRELQKNIQMQLQMLAGQQNVNDRYEASKIKVRNGGHTKRKLRNVGYDTSLLRGSDNMPFTVTDGGGVIALGSTPEGYDLYEIYGNDHEHYHKTRGGKHKSGVGIKFADGNVIEGEGNQHGPAGEKMLVTPDNAYFISRHTLKGFNPAKNVDAGMNPVLAYAIQEQIKAENGISDDGNGSSPVKKIMGGGTVDDYSIYNMTGPQPGVDTIGDTVAGIAYINQNNKRRLRNGGKCRRAMRPGGSLKWDWATGSFVNPDGTTNKPTINPTGLTINGNRWNWSTGDWVNVTPQEQTRVPYKPQSVTTTPKQNTSSGTRSGFWNSPDLWGAGITALGNLGGAWITSAGNRRAARTLAGAYDKAANLMSDAYNSLQTIDMNNIRREDYAAAHAMPALQAPVSQAAAPLAGVDRQLQRRLANAGRYSASGASAQRRMNIAEVDAQDMRNKIYSEDQQLMQNIRQQNAQRITEAAMENARLDAAANQQYAGAYLDMLKYNNDIVNERILGASGALAEGAVNGANAISQAQASNAAAWAQSLVGSSQGFSNALTNMATRRANLEMVKLGAAGDTQASYYANSGLSTVQEAEAAYDALVRQYNAATDDNTKEILKRRANTIASGRGFKLLK